MATLVMTISQNSCEHKTFKGYEVALGKREAHWNTAYGMIGDTANPFYSGIARTVYIIAILISIFLFCAALSSLYSSLQSYRIRLILLAIAGSIFVFSVIDFSLVFGVAPAWETGIKMMIWVLIAGVWIRYSLTRDETKRQRWLRIRAPLSVFSTPFFLLAVFYVLENLRLPGLIAFFIGNIVLFLGLLQTHFRHTPASPGASTGQQTVAMEDPLLPL